MTNRLHITRREKRGEENSEGGFIPGFMRCLVAVIMLLFTTTATAQVRVGAARPDKYLPLFEGKRVALLSNHTGIVDGQHTLDRLLEQGVDVRMIFAPEHGFRGDADAGARVNGGRDAKTGLPIVSLFGAARRPTPAQLEEIDVIVTDIQDVGLRFYTYYVTMLDCMEAAAETGKEFVIFDRPNPNGMSVDGPVLDMSLRSGVGRLPIPVLHGLTLGEMAKMACGEGWTAKGKELKLEVVECEGYTHATRYELPVAPSPNLPDMLSVYLYPSMCYFEATPMSLGRGTDSPFCVYGHPALAGRRGYTFSFTPRSRPGATKPPLMDRKCYGKDLRGVSADSAIAMGVNPEYLIDAYNAMGRDPKFLTSFFEKLIGSRKTRKQIESGMNASEIKATWRDELEAYNKLRDKYLIYPKE